MMSVFAGILAGLGHVLSGPDHWLGVGPLAMTSQKRAAWAGLSWGAGHAVSTLVIGGLVLFFRQQFAIEQFSHVAEMTVGFALIATGAWTVYRSRAIVIHQHAHRHGDDSHEHYHLHMGESEHDLQRSHAGHTHAAFGLGLLHGSAGAGPLWAIIPTLALDTTPAVLYLLSFAVMATLTMVLVALVVSYFTARQSPIRFYKGLKSVGWITIIFGGYWTAIALSSWVS